MSRIKKTWKIKMQNPGELTWSEPIDSESETISPRRTAKSVPMVEADMPDGRRVFISFESPFTHDTSAEEYIRRMRLLAATLTRAADQSEQLRRMVEAARRF